MKTTGDNSDAGNMGAEDPGAVDNRLSVNVNDERWPAVADWEDGEEYDIKNVRVRQMAPGEFEIISMSVPGGDAAENKGEPGEDAPKTPEAKKDKAYKGITNPAVIGLLGKKR